ncbi:MAG: hypothetical protein ACOH18_03385 [Candidatus Saccharimonadaceae bacterium]
MVVSTAQDVLDVRRWVYEHTKDWVVPKKPGSYQNANFPIRLYQSETVRVGDQIIELLRGTEAIVYHKLKLLDSGVWDVHPRDGYLALVTFFFYNKDGQLERQLTVRKNGQANTRRPPAA